MIRLVHFDESTHGTFGRWIMPDFSLFSGELMWQDNRPNVSRIPCGRYKGIWTFSPRFQRGMYLIVPVDGRSGIRIHLGNFFGVKALGLKCQFNGCIGLGERLGYLGGQKSLLCSAPAIRRFERYMDGKPFDLEIIDDFGRAA